MSEGVQASGLLLCLCIMHWSCGAVSLVLAIYSEEGQARAAAVICAVLFVLAMDSEEVQTQQASEVLTDHACEMQH